MRKPRLLLVDDDIDLTNNLSWLLSRRSYEVSAVNDGEGALRIVGEQEFDVVILDRKMPGLDGISALRVLKMKHPNLEFIILTGAPSIDSAIKGLELGAYDYATKPITMTDLEEKIRMAFERKLLLA
ncbi:MAG: response regulator [Desulfomonile sp.]|jgi:DNA-binding response OmpR family regulator